MAAFKGLVDPGGACGTGNPLIKLSQHYSQDHAKRDQAFRKNGKALISCLEQAFFCPFKKNSGPKKLKKLLSPKKLKG